MAFTYDVGNTYLAPYELTLQQFKLTKPAMDLAAAGDGDAIYVNDGSDPFTNGQFGAGIPGNICNPGAWYLFNARDLSYQICFKRRSPFAGFVTGVFVSPNSNYDLSGAGPSTPPTADDEAELAPINSSQYIGGGSSINVEDYTLHAIYGDADENYSWIVWHTIRGGRVPGGSPSSRPVNGMFVDVPDAIAGDSLDLRAVFGVPATGFFGDRIFDSRGRDEENAGPQALCFTSGRAVGQPPRGVGLITPVRDSGTYAMPADEEDSDWTSKPWGFQNGIWWANPQIGGIGRSRMVGQSKLFRPCGAPTGRRSPYNSCWGFSADQTRCYLDNVSIPWDANAGNILV